MESDPIRQSVQQRPLQQPPLQTPQGAPLIQNIGQRVNPQNVNPNVSGVRPALPPNGVPYQQQPLNSSGIAGQPIRQPPPLRRVDSQASVQGIPQQHVQRPPITTPTGQQQPLYQQFAPQQVTKQPVQNLSQQQQPVTQQQAAPRPLLNPQNPSLNQLPRVPLVPNQSRPPFPSQQNSYPPVTQPQQPIPQQFLPQQTQIRPQNIRPQQTQPQPQQQSFVNNPNQTQLQNSNQSQQRVGQPQVRQVPPNLQNQNSFERIKSPMQGRDSPDRMLSDPPNGKMLGLTVNKDDDDDVVIGRATTPKPKQLQNQTIEEEINNRNINSGNLMPTKPNDEYRSPSPRPANIQRTDSMRSIPSRPPSSTGFFQNDNIIRPNSNSPDQTINTSTSRDGIFRQLVNPNDNSSTLKYKSFTPPTISPQSPGTGIPESNTIEYPSLSRPSTINTNLTNFNFQKPLLNQNHNKPQQSLSQSSTISYPARTPLSPSPSPNPIYNFPNSQKSSSIISSPISLNVILNSSSISPDQLNTNSSPTTKQQQPQPSLQQSNNQKPQQQQQPTYQARSQYSTSPSSLAGDKVTFNDTTTPSSQPLYGNNDHRPTTINANNSRSISSSKTIGSKGDNDSGVDESTQGNEKHGPGSPGSPLKSPSKIPGPRPPSAASNKSRSTSKTRSLISPETPTDPSKKKLPMNKVQVGAAPSPNLKVVRSKIGSLENAAYKPGGGQVKIETKKIDIKAAPKIAAKNENYHPGGGDKKIISTKLQWNAKSKIGSLENAAHKPGGGDKKIETLKTDFKIQAKPKIGSKDNLKYQPGGGDIKTTNVEDKATKNGRIQTHKLDIKAQSKIGSLDNVKHRPGGGDVKIFDDKEYLKSVDHPITPTPPSQLWRSQTLTTSISLPAECLVLSLTTPSTPSKSKAAKSVNFGRPKSARTVRDGRAIHPTPFRCY